MLLVRMEHEHLPGHAEAPLAAIRKGLHAFHRDAESIGIVAMRLEGLAGKLRFHPLDSRKSRRNHDPVCAGLRAQTFKTLEGVTGYILVQRDFRTCMKETGMFDTKIAIVLRNNLASWQKLNVTAFLMSGIAGQHPEMIGEAYKDRAGNLYNPLSIQPIIVLSAEGETMSTIHRRSLERGITSSLFIEEMFATGHDAANRAVFAEYAPDDAKVVGIAIRAEKKIVDKITKGATMHQ